MAPSDLTGISTRLSKAFEHVLCGGRVVFDSIDVPLLYGREEQVHRLPASAVQIPLERDACGAYCLVRDAVTDETVSKFREPCDTSVSTDSSTEFGN